MFRIGRRVLLATAAIAASFMVAAPANAYYVIYWYNSYGGGYSYHCDNGNVTKSEGVAFVGGASVFVWAPAESSGQVCPPPDLSYW